MIDCPKCHPSPDKLVTSQAEIVDIKPSKIVLILLPSIFMSLCFGWNTTHYYVPEMCSIAFRGNLSLFQAA